VYARPDDPRYTDVNTLRQVADGRIEVREANGEL